MARSYITDEQVNDIDFLSESEAYTLSGTLQSQINTKPDTLLELSDTPGVYANGMFLKSTAVGIEWATVSGSGEQTVISYFEAIDSAGGQTIDSATTINLDSVLENSDVSIFSLSNDEITVNTTDTLLFCYKVSGGISTGTRTRLIGWMEEYNGSSWSILSKSYVSGYSRTINEYSTASSPPFIVKTTSGYKYRLRCQTVDADVVTMAVNASSVTIFSIKGARGVAGDQGPVGVSGTNGTNGTDGVDGVDGADGADGGVTTLSGLSDTPPNYNDGKFLQSTLSGTIWSEIDPTVSGSGLYDALYNTGNVLFGANFAYVEDDTISSTNSTSWQNKLTLTASGIPNGSYRIGFYFLWTESRAPIQFQARVMIDDSIDIYEQDSKVPKRNDYSVTSGFYYYESVVSGTHFIDIDYRSADSSATAYIKQARLEFWRVY